MFASNLRNEFAIVILGYSGITKNFLLNKLGRSIPTSIRCETKKVLFNSFNRINSCRSIPTSNSGILKVIMMRCFNRINSGRSIPTKIGKKIDGIKLNRFNRINSGRSIPTRWQCHLPRLNCAGVSIVSIQADQSRLSITMPTKAEVTKFQSYQFRQINPDLCLIVSL